MEKKIIENASFGQERALYAAKGVKLIGCRFEGIEDGESALKESSFVELENCYMDLRYPFWHVKGISISNCELTPNCRAALWYSSSIDVKQSKMFGIKAIRECQNVNLEGVEVLSPEFGWRSHSISIKDSRIESEYAFFESDGIKADNLRFKGKYSFQYTRGLHLSHCILDTKDAFWHCEGAIIEDCEVNGEYLAWYSKDLTFINCRIKGTQPFCYCQNLRLVDCVFEGSDLAFEYSEANGNCLGHIASIKNFRLGELSCEQVDQIIKTEDSVYPCLGKVLPFERG